MTYKFKLDSFNPDQVRRLFSELYSILCRANYDCKLSENRIEFIEEKFHFVDRYSIVQEFINPKIDGKITLVNSDSVGALKWKVNFKIVYIKLLLVSLVLLYLARPNGLTSIVFIAIIDIVVFCINYLNSKNKLRDHIFIAENKLYN